MKIISTREYKTRGVKCLVYGEAGIGKTCLCATAPSPIIISAESGLLSLAEVDVPAIEITSSEQLTEAYNWVTQSKEAQKFSTICIDSLSDVAETLLHELKQYTKDPRQAYGGMADEMADHIRNFRDIPNKHIYFTAKIKRLEDESTGKVNFIPSVPGQALLQGLPFFFDELFVYRHGKDSEGRKIRYLQTQGDFRYTAKDRSGKLAPKELPNLSHIFTKVLKPKECKSKPTKETT